jgi:hypothetical protein
MSAYIVENSIKHHNPFGTVMNLEECVNFWQKVAHHDKHVTLD